MERTISQEERIRRAEEIYNRRKMSNGNGIRVSTNSVNTNKNKVSLFKKMCLQIAICAVIYIVFYIIKNSNYIFSDNVINKTREMLSYDINFGNVYQQISMFVENNKDRLSSWGIVVENKEEEQPINEINNEIREQEKNEKGGVGGAETNEIQEETSSKESKKTTMEQDAEYVKKNYNFKIPLKGTITSRYGAREKTDIISANHQGIDIGAETGTAIYAAMDGNVTLVSSEGDYRKACGDKKWRCYDKICSLQ